MGSATNSLVLEPATPEDVPAITELWFASFTQPVIGQLFPNTPGMHQWHRDWHLGDIQKSHCRYLRVVDTESKDEQGRPRLVAFGKWDLAMPDERGRRFPHWHADSPYQECEDFIAELEQARKRVMGDEKHYCMNGTPLKFTKEDIVTDIRNGTKKTWIHLALILIINGAELARCLSSGAATWRIRMALQPTWMPARRAHRYT